MVAKREPFNPSDPFDAMSEMIRRDVVDVALRAHGVTFYRELGATEQLECFVAGAMTAIVGVCFANIQKDGRDAMIDYLSKAWPQARETAEGIEQEPHQ